MNSSLIIHPNPTYYHYSDAYNTTLTFSPALAAKASSQWTVDSLKKLPTGTQPQISVEELVAAEMSVRADETVRKLCAEVGE
jgi:primary-amine oxidase